MNLSQTLDLAKGDKRYDPLANAAQDALRKGMICIFPNEHQLFIDIDDPKMLEHIDWAISVLIQTNGFGIQHHDYIKRPSTKEGHYHVIIEVEETLTPEKRILLQALLGSDIRRELLGYSRVLSGIDKPTLFFEKENIDESQGPQTL